MHVCTRYLTKRIRFACHLIKKNNEGNEVREAYFKPIFFATNKINGEYIAYVQHNMRIIFTQEKKIMK